MWVVREGVYLGASITAVLVRWLGEALRRRLLHLIDRLGELGGRKSPARRQSPQEPVRRAEELLDPAVMSRCLGLPVKSVTITAREAISMGAGGTGTSRTALTATLASDEVLHLFVKLPTSSIAERAFMTVFQVYDNELLFYGRYINDLLSRTRCAGSRWTTAPQVFHCKYV